jgi:hypothetical protein
MRTLLNTLLASSAMIASTASADLITLNFPINVEQEVPAPTIPTGFNPSGMGTVIVNTSTMMIQWEITYSGLTGPIVGPGAHFHGPADFGQTAGVELFIAGHGSDFPLPQPASGVLTGSAQLTSQQQSDLLAGLWYVNIHTAMNQPGEIRGQVVPTPGGAAALALASIACIRRRR